MTKNYKMNTVVQTLLKVPTLYTIQRKYTYEYVKNTIGRSQTLAFDFDVEYNSLNKDVVPSPIIQINRQNVFMNEDYLGETLIGELIESCSESLFPLNLIVNQYGFLTGIDRYEDILSRWGQLKPNLQTLYNNDISHHLIHKIENLYKSSETLLKNFHNDWFYLTFFFPLYREYGTKRIHELEYDFPVIQDEKAIYHLLLELQDTLDESGKTVILVRGNALQKDADAIKGYFLLNDDMTIHEIKLNLYASESGEEIQIKIWESVIN